MASISFTVPGKPRPKERPRLGKGGFAYTPAKTQVYEALIARKAKEAMDKAGLQPFNSPVCMDLTIIFAIPKSFTKEKRLAAQKGLVECIGRVDADNVVKIFGDAIQGRKVKKEFVPGAVIFNDNRITHGSFKKIYGDTEMVHITIRELSQWQPTKTKKNGPPTMWSAGPLIPSFLTQEIHAPIHLNKLLNLLHQ